MQSGIQQVVIEMNGDKILPGFEEFFSKVTAINPLRVGDLTFTTVETLLNTAVKFDDQLKDIQQELSNRGDTESAVKLAQIASLKITASSCIVDLKFRLSAMYCQESQDSSSKAKKTKTRKESLNNARILVNDAYNLSDSIKQFFPKGYFDPFNEKKEKINKLYNDKYGDDEISKLLSKASRIKNKEEAEKKYQEALTLTSDPQKKFKILIQHSNANMLAFNSYKATVYTSSAEAYESYFQVIKKAYVPLVSASQITLSEPRLSNDMISNLNCIFDNLYRLIRETINQCQSKILEKDLTRRRNLFQDATEYAGLINKLSVKTNRSDDTWKELNDQFTTEYRKLLQEIVTKSEEERIQKEKNEKSLKAMNVYLEKFDEIITKFESKHKPRCQRTSELHTQVDDHPVDDEASDTDDHNKTTEVNLAENPQPIKFEINLEEQKKLLEQAEKDGDLLRQFKINVLIAEYYRMKSQKIHTMSEIISAKNHIITADKMIDQIKQDANHSVNITEFEKGISIVLEDIASLFNRFISREERIKKKREAEHIKIKNEIISKYGIYAWKRNNLDAIERHNEINASNEDKLNQLKSNRDEIQEISTKYTHVLHEYLSSTSAVTQLSTDSVIANETIRTLHRSKSSHSFFNQDKINDRKSKQQFFETQRKDDLDRFNQRIQVLYNAFTSRRRHD